MELSVTRRSTRPGLGCARGWHARTPWRAGRQTCRLSRSARACYSSAVLACRDFAAGPAGCPGPLGPDQCPARRSQPESPDTAASAPVPPRSQQPKAPPPRPAADGQQPTAVADFPAQASNCAVLFCYILYHLSQCPVRRSQPESPDTAASAPVPPRSRQPKAPPQRPAADGRQPTAVADFPAQASYCAFLRCTALFYAVPLYSKISYYLKVYFLIPLVAGF